MRLRETTHVIRDVGDFPEIEEISTKLLPDASLYLKREVLRSDLGTIVGRNAIVVYAPMPFDLEPYEIRPADKTVDVFYAARDNSPHRRQARQTLSKLALEGVSVDLPEERLPFDEFLARMSKARLVVSPRGQGEHCYRHYEALLVGTCPLINRPEKAIHYDLVHKQHALFYEATDEGLRNSIAAALSDPPLLDSIAASGRALVRERHNKAAICRLILKELGLLDALSS